MFDVELMGVIGKTQNIKVEPSTFVPCEEVNDDAPGNVVVRRGDYRAPGFWWIGSNSRSSSILSQHASPARCHCVAIDAGAENTLTLFGDSLTLDALMLNGVMPLRAHRVPAARRHAL